MNKKIALSLIVATCIAAPAAAQDATAPTTKIDISDINLASEKGQERMGYRIRSAARKVCQRPANHSSRAQLHYKQCLNAAIAQAEKQVAAKLDTSVRYAEQDKADTKPRS